MSNKPLVTIVTPSYNQGLFIEKTILSVLNQSYRNIQYILVDGGSTDNTMDTVNKYRDKIDIVIHEKDNGQADAINKGFILAQGELAGWLNSDDILYPECVERIVELYSQKPDGSIFYNRNGRIINYMDEKVRDYKKFIPDGNYLLTKKYDVLQQGSFYRTDILQKVNYLDPTIYYCMDLDLWLKLSKYGPIYSLDLPPLSAFRIWENSKTFTGGLKFLKNIREVLLRNGAAFYSKTVIITYWYGIKSVVKKAFKSKA